LAGRDLKGMSLSRGTFHLNDVVPHLPEWTKTQPGLSSPVSYSDLALSAGPGAITHDPQLPQKCLPTDWPESPPLKNDLNSPSSVKSPSGMVRM
jgi:hypothetical protein